MAIPDPTVPDPLSSTELVAVVGGVVIVAVIVIVAGLVIVAPLVDSVPEAEADPDAVGLESPPVDEPGAVPTLLSVLVLVPTGSTLPHAIRTNAPTIADRSPKTR